MKPTVAIDAHHIASKLWIGSHPRAPIAHIFDVVVLCALEYQDTIAGVHNVKAPLVDYDSIDSGSIRTAVSAAKTIHEIVQAPLAICSQSVLGAAGLAAQPFANVGIDGRVYPLSLFLLSVAESGATEAIGAAWQRTSRKRPSRS